MRNERQKVKHIYIIKNLENNRIKIGIADDVKARFESIICSSGCRLEIVYVSKKTERAKEIESIIHCQLDEFRYIGEWFNVEESKAIDIAISCIDMIGYEYDKNVRQRTFKNINLNEYSKVVSGIYSDFQGKLFSINYNDGLWKVNELQKID